VAEVLFAMLEEEMYFFLNMQRAAEEYISLCYFISFSFNDVFEGM